jgi:hypothetical protein
MDQSLPTHNHLAFRVLEDECIFLSKLRRHVSDDINLGGLPEEVRRFANGLDALIAARKQRQIDFIQLITGAKIIIH